MIFIFPAAVCICRWYPLEMKAWHCYEETGGRLRTRQKVVWPCPLLNVKSLEMSLTCAVGVHVTTSNWRFNCNMNRTTKSTMAGVGHSGKKHKSSHVWFISARDNDYFLILSSDCRLVLFLRGTTHLTNHLKWTLHASCAVNFLQPSPPFPQVIIGNDRRLLTSILSLLDTGKGGIGDQSSDSW